MLISFDQIDGYGHDGGDDDDDDEKNTGNDKTLGSIHDAFLHVKVGQQVTMLTILLRVWGDTYTNQGSYVVAATLLWWHAAAAVPPGTAGCCTGGEGGGVACQAVGVMTYGRNARG